MSIESRFNKESPLNSFDKVPEEDELGPDTVPEEELLDEEENKRQEDEVEEIEEDGSEQEEQFSFPEEIKGDTIKENEYLLGLRRIIDKLKAEIGEKHGERNKRTLRKQLKKVCLEYSQLSGIPTDPEGRISENLSENPAH